MSLRPVKARRGRRSKYSQLRAQSQYKPWKGWNWDSTKKKGFELFGRKTFVLLLIGLAVTIGLGAMYADPNNFLFHSYIKASCNTTMNHVSVNDCVDPTTIIWTRTDNSPSSLADFNLGGTNPSYLPNCDLSGIGNDCLSTSPVVSNTSIAITHDTIGDLGIANGKSLLFHVGWIASNNVTLGTWGFFLTKNNTAPNHAIGSSAQYDPFNDPNVILLVTFSCSSGICNFVTGGGGGTYVTTVWLNKNLGTSSMSNQNSGACNSSGTSNAGSCMMQFFSNRISACLGIGPCSGANIVNVSELALNFTGLTLPVPNPACVFASGGAAVESGPGCSFMLTTNSGHPTWLSSDATFVNNIQQNPFNAKDLFLGFYSQATPLQSPHIGWEWNPGTTTTLTNPTVSNGMRIGYFVNSPTGTSLAPNIDTGGFFGPIIRALIDIGVFILNEILGFISFIAPALQTALSFMEGIIASVLNLIGGLIGYPTAGTDLFTAINALLSFFGQAPTIFANVPALFSRFVDANSAYFTWLPTALSIASTIASLAINSIGFVLTIIQFAFKLVAGVYLILLLTLFLVYTGDDSLGGILGFLETTQWLILGPLGWLARVLNFILDIVTSLIGLIPKPMIQMVAHAFPRIPIVETNARFVNPSFDLAAIRSGNMLSVWAWFVDFTFLAWYNGVTPALPGSLGNLLPGMPATTFAALRGFLPVLEIFLIIISALAFIIWPMNQMLSVFSLDLDVLDFEMSPGRKLASGGLGGIRISKAKKRFQKLKPGVEFKEHGKLKSRTQVELEDLEKQKREAKTMEEVKAARARDEAIRQRELESKAGGKDVKRVRQGPLGPEDE